MASSNASDKEFVVALILLLLVGGLGIHDFYLGNTGWGIAKLLTLNFLGIGSLIDLIKMVTGSYRDGNGLVLSTKKNSK